MTNRTILFGYTYDNGRIVLDSLAADIVKEIFSHYLFSVMFSYMSLKLLK